MDQRPAATRVPDPDAAEFIRFCYRRRRVGWPELYDEMCAVAARGLFRGLVAEDLASHGIGFALFDAFEDFNQMANAAVASGWGCCFSVTSIVSISHHGRGLEANALPGAPGGFPSPRRGS